MALPTIIQSPNGNEGNPASSIRGVAEAFGSANTAGNTIVAFATFALDAATKLPHTDCEAIDTQRNSYTRINQSNTNPLPAGAQSVAVMVASAINGGANTVTTQFAGSGNVEDFWANRIYELGGVLGAIDSSNGANAQNGLAAGGTIQSGPIVVTSAQVPCLLMAVGFNTSANQNTTPTAQSPSGMTLVNHDTIWAFGATNPSACVAWWSITAPGTYRGQFTNTSTHTEDCSSNAVAFFGTSSPAALGGAASDLTIGAAALATAIQAAGAATDAVTATGVLVGPAGAQLVGAATDAVTAAAAVTNWATVTLVAPLYTGPQGILDVAFPWDNTPVAGDVIEFDGDKLIVLPNGEYAWTLNTWSAVIQFNDGTGNSVRLLTVVPGISGFAQTRTSALGALTQAAQLRGSAQDITTALGALGSAFGPGGWTADSSIVTADSYFTMDGGFITPIAKAIYAIELELAEIARGSVALAWLPIPLYSTTITYSVTVNDAAEFSTTGTTAQVNGLVVDTDYRIKVVGGMPGQTPVQSREVLYRFGSTTIAYTQVPLAAVPVGD